MADQERAGAASFTVRDALTAAVLVLVLAAAVTMKVAVDFTGNVVTGEVVDKHEAIEMPLDDTWRHVFDVTYHYRPPGESAIASGRHGVSEALFDRLQVGSPVQVRTLQLPFLGVFGRQSAIAGTTFWSREPQMAESARELAEFIGIAIAALLGFVAYRRDSRPLGLAAGTIAAAAAASILLLGAFVFPLLFWAWRAKQGRGLGWVLLVSMPVAAAALWYRIPWPPPMPAGPQERGTAVVRNVQTVTRIWSSWAHTPGSKSGESIWSPFQMVDLEFTPRGRTAPVHAMDRVDLDSVPDLRPGATVPVVYAIAAPRAGRMTTGTRRYGERIALYVFGLTFGLGAVLAFIVVPIGMFVGRLIKRLVSASPVLRLASNPDALAQLLDSLPPDDPRRRELERRLGPRHTPPRPGSGT